jgi:hypothetical protein
MDIDVDTFLTTVYCVVDDLYQAHYAAQKPVRRGAAPEMSDSEVLTVVILAQWQQDRSEAAFLRYAHAHWRGYFPRLLTQSAFNRRARDVWGVLCHLGPQVGVALRALLASPPAYAVCDTVPVPLMRRCRGDRRRCFGLEAAVGCGGSDEDWYYGVALLTVVEADGSISGFVLGPADTDDRWLADALLRWRQDPTAAAPTAQDLVALLGPSHKAGGARRGPTGPLGPRAAAGVASDTPYLADLGFAGTAWQAHWRAHYGAAVLSKADYAAAPAAERAQAAQWLSSLRQVGETVGGVLTDLLGLKFPRARTYRGLLTRIAAKIAAFNILLYLNHLYERPTFAYATPLA